MYRIAFIDYFPTHYRRRLYEEIAKRSDADFYFFSSEQERHWNKKIPLAHGGAYRRVELPRRRIAGQSFMPGVARAILSRRYDAVIKNLNGKLMLPLTYNSAKAARVPFVLWTGMWYHPQTRVHQATKPLTEGIYRGADAIVTYGDHVRDFVLQTSGVEPSKVFVAGQAVEPERFEAVEPERDHDPPEVLFIGQFEERKGLRYLFEAFDALADTPARLRLVGNGSDEPWVRQQAEARPNVDLVGYVPQQELPSQLARARCLVLPSVTTELDKEPWGLVVNEAMHAGLPAVVTDGVGAAPGGLVRDGENGFVVPERDSSALAGALRTLVEDRELAARFGDAARQAAGEFTHARMADAFLNAVDYAVASRRRR